MSSSNSPLRVGIVGVGWGSIVLGPAFAAVDGFEVAAICSRQQAKVDKAAARLGIGDTSTDWEAFVARDDLDLIAIATPTDLHHDQAMAAIAAGKHILVEKPVGVNSQETSAMLAAAEGAGVKHAVCFEGRFEPNRYRYRELVKDGAIGDLFYVVGQSTGDFWHPMRGLQSEWMYQLERGGGYLMGMASHDIDFACSLFGEPVAVCADVRSSVPQRPREDGTILDVDADDTSALLIRMANGGLITIATSAVAVGEGHRNFAAYGSAGSLSTGGPLLDAHAGQTPIIATTAGEEPREVEASNRALKSGMELPERRATSAIRALSIMLEDWLPAFDGEPTNTPTLVDGDRVARIIDAARASSAGAGWVTL